MTVAIAYALIGRREVMTKQWFLLKNLDMDANVMSACADVLRGLERPPNDWPHGRLELAIQECLQFLEALEKGTRVQLGENLPLNPYFYHLSIRLCQVLDSPPARLREALETTAADLKDGRLSKSSSYLLRTLIKALQGQASDRWAELRSSPAMDFL